MDTSLLKPIHNQEHFEQALTAFRKVFHAPKGTPEAEYAHHLSLLIEDYDKKHYSIDEIDPIEAIKQRMEERNMKPVDLGRLIGARSNASDVLNRKRRLSLSMIRKIEKTLQIPAEILIQEYQLTTSS